MTITFLALQY